MKSYDLHIFFNRDGIPMASCTLHVPEKLPAVELSTEEVDMLADIATRCACAADVERIMERRS